MVDSSGDEEENQDEGTSNNSSKASEADSKVMTSEVMTVHPHPPILLPNLRMNLTRTIIYYFYRKIILIDIL